MSTKAFGARSWLQWLSAFGVATALAGATSAVFSAIFNSPAYGVYTVAPTVLVALVWVWLLRWPSTVGRSSIRKGWLWSIPLAALNSALASMLFFAYELGATGVSKLLGAAIAGVTFGAMFWVPSLLFTVLCFGTPIAWAQRLATRGLAGAERGEAIVGGASAAIAVGALIATLLRPIGAGLDSRAIMGHWLTLVAAAAGAVFGLLTLLVARERESKRRHFVADVEAGKVPRFRVDATPEGKVLVRVVSQENSYRVGDYEEEVAALNEAGELVTPLRVDAS
jgi:hypothetical protein